MERLLWIGNPHYADALPACGWTEALAHRPADPAPLCWNDLKRIAGFEPDVLVVAGDCPLPPVLGMENFPCLTVFFATPAHGGNWHPAYAQGFDAALVSSRDNLPHFQGSILPCENIWWSPPFAPDAASPAPATPEWDCLFVEEGWRLRPQSRGFRDAIASLLPGAHMENIFTPAHFPRARLLLHHAAGSELESIVFEAMGNGRCLVTPRVKDGLGNLFVDGEHFVGYAPEDPGDAFYRIDFLLKRPELRAHIGQEARAEIDARHRAIHRAQAMTDHLCDLYMGGAEALVKARLDSADSRRGFLEDIYMAAGSADASGAAKEALLAAARGEFGLNGLKPE